MKIEKLKKNSKKSEIIDTINNLIDEHYKLKKLVYKHVPLEFR